MGTKGCCLHSLPSTSQPLTPEHACTVLALCVCVDRLWKTIPAQSYWTPKAQRQQGVLDKRLTAGKTLQKVCLGRGLRKQTALASQQGEQISIARPENMLLSSWDLGTASELPRAKLS